MRRINLVERRVLKLLGIAAFALPAAFVTHAQPAIKSGTGVRIVLTGDSIVNRRLSVFDDPASVALFQIIRGADASFTNFETLVTSYENPAAAQSGGDYMNSPSWVPSELKWAGFSLVSTANNHAYDYGAPGLLSTMQALDAAGLVHAGTGLNLAMARSPAYLDTGKGRVALIAVASTFTEGSLAGAQRPDLIGRPGVNPLRFNTTYTVSEDMYKSLQKLSALMHGDGKPEQEAHSQSQHPVIRIEKLRFQEGNTFAVHTQPDKDDLQALVTSVRNACRQSDWVIVYSHTHESGFRGQQYPPEFQITAAHAAIDAGADVFVSSGPHILRGIEIYKGKPIFYSLANFIFEPETILYQPAESYDSQGLPWNATVADYFDARAKTKGFPSEKAVWESVVAEVTFNKDHTLNRITLTPISLGFQEPRSERGRPRLASPEQSKLMIATLANLSEHFGTKVVYSSGKGIVQGDITQK